MGLFSKLNKNKLNPINVEDNEIVAIADGYQIDVTTVSDSMFAQKVMGDSIAFRYERSKVIICSPANGVLSVLFPTGHAFGILMKNGVEILIHIGINTVNSNGVGFKKLNFKKDNYVKAGDPIVEVDLEKLSSMYDLTTMLIITNNNNQNIEFIDAAVVKRGQKIVRYNL